MTALIGANTFEHSVWWGTRYTSRGRLFVLDQPAHIYRCPLCEYAMTALTGEGIDTIRRTHVRTCHVEHVAELAALTTLDRSPL